MLFPRKAEVLEIHRQLLEHLGGLPGLRDEGLLDSALLAAANRQHYEGAGLATCAATYAFHLTRNHPFVDGNKRVGAALAEIFARGDAVAVAASVFSVGVAASAGTRHEKSECRARSGDLAMWQYGVC